MAGLLHSLNVGSQSLSNSRQGVDTTAHNIANAQTEGYSRQRVRTVQRDPLATHGVLIGSGAYVGSIERFHDKVVTKQLNQANSDTGDSEARFDTLEHIGAIFDPELSASVADEIGNFFNAWQDMVKYPEELTTRAAVQEEGKNVVAAFHRVDHDLRSQRRGINDYIDKSVSEINSIVKSISDLNSRIRVMEAGANKSSNDLRDQRELLVKDLSNRININYYEDRDGMLTIHGPAEFLLVDRGRNATLQVLNNGDNNGLFDVVAFDSEMSTSRNLTKHISGGRLHGLLDVRDRVSKGLIDQNNHLARTFVDKFNDIHKQGYGLNDFKNLNGRDFFTTSKEQETTAQNIDLDFSVLQSTDAISASSLANTIGDNVIANKIVQLRNERVFSENDENFTDFYNNMVGNLGVETLRVKHGKESNEIILANLKTKRESISGVSLDEEAQNLIRWQTAFTASSKVITTVDEMFDTLLNMKR